MPDTDAMLTRLRGCMEQLRAREAIYSRDTLDALVDVVAYFDALDGALTSGAVLPDAWTLAARALSTPSAARLALAVELDRIDFSEDHHSVDDLVAVRDQLIRIAADALSECQRLERTLDEVAAVLTSPRNWSYIGKLGSISKAMRGAGYEVPEVH